MSTKAHLGQGGCHRTLSSSPSLYQTHQELTYILSLVLSNHACKDTVTNNSSLKMHASASLICDSHFTNSFCSGIAEYLHVTNASLARCWSVAGVSLVCHWCVIKVSLESCWCVTGTPLANH